MADTTPDIRDLRRELDKALTQFNADIDVGNKNLRSIITSAKELGNAMHNVVNPSSMMEKALNRIGTEYSALKTKSNAYEAIMEKIKDHRSKIYKEAEKLKKETDSQLETLGKKQAVLTAISTIYSTMMSLGEEYDKLLSDTAKAQGTTKDEINKQYEAIQKINTGLSSNLASNQEILSGVTAIRKEYALSTSQLASVGKEAANISRLTGLSADEAVKFQTTLAEVAGTSLREQEAMTAIAAKAAEAANVPMGQVMRDVANISQTVRTIFKGNSAELIIQAAEARKLGTTLDAAGKSAESLLNFDTSISAEMKASALLGQSLNFNESRRLAFHGDLLGAEKALQREIQKVGDLDKLNYNQRKALSEVTGKPFEELQKIETQRKNMLDMEREFPEEAEKLRTAQNELAILQKKGPEERKKELELMLRQKTAETELQKLALAKHEVLNNIGKLFQPLYSFIISISTVFFKFISLITNWGDSTFSKWVGSIVVGAVAITLAFKGLKFGLTEVLGFLGDVFAKAAESAGKGVGKGLTSLSKGISSLGKSIQTIPVGKLIGVGVALGVVALAAIGFARAFQMMSDVSTVEVLLLVGSLVVLGAALVALGTAIGPFLPAVIGLSVALAIVGLAAMAVGKAFSFVSEAFASLPSTISGVAVGLEQIANIGFLKLMGAAAGIGYLSTSIFGLGVSLLLFPVSRLTSITSQIALLSESAQGLQYAIGSLKELASIKLPKIEFGGLASLALLNHATKKNESDEIKAGFKVLADKLDSLIDTMSNGGIAVNLDGVNVNYALARSASQRGQRGQTTIQ